MIDKSEIVAHFSNLQKPGDPFTVTNWSSYSFDSDFFLPADAFTLELSSTAAKIKELLTKISLGDMIKLEINGLEQSTVIIEKADVSYNRNGGSTLTLSGRDQFGLVCDSNLEPDVNITADNTYMQAIVEVLKPFGWKEENIIGTENAEDEARRLELSCGQAIGSCVSSNNGRLKAKNLTDQLKRQLKPQKGEGRVAFIQRVFKRAGWVVKLLPPGNMIWVGPPLYKRSKAPIHKLTHLILEPSQNNVLEGNIGIDWSKQPSYIIGEATANGGKRRKSVSNVIMFNDLTFFPNKDGEYSASSDEIIEKLREYTDKGFYAIKPNIDLINARPAILANSEAYSNQLRALYVYDDDAKSIEELQFSVTNKMAEFNNSFLTLEYEVDGHMNNGAVWQINELCTVEDDSFGGYMKSDFWIQKRRFTKSRSRGTKTQLTLKIPYAYGYEYTTASPSAPSKKASPPKSNNAAQKPPAQKPPPQNANTEKKPKPDPVKAQPHAAPGVFQIFNEMRSRRDQASY